MRELILDFIQTWPSLDAAEKFALISMLFACVGVAAITVLRIRMMNRHAKQMSEMRERHWAEMDRIRKDWPSR